MGKLMKGNEALAEGAIRAGCRFYAGYPITPQTEILEYMSWRQKEVGGTFIQGESEIASVCMVFGAAGSGARAMTSSSACGFSLKQEGIAYITGAAVPAVFVSVMRYGNGAGSIHQGQDSYWQAVKGGGHGDYHLIVLAPNSVQENADMAYISFDIAEKYRHPVLILSDAAIGQMVEPVVFPELKEHDINKFDWTAKGTSVGGDCRIITDLFFGNPSWNDQYLGTMRYIMENEQRWEEYMTEDAELIFVAYGISSRIAKDAVDLGREKGIKLGLIRPKTLWPYPRKAFKKLGNQVKALVTIEMNMMGQMREDVLHACKYKIPCYSYASAQFVPDEKKAVTLAEDILAGKLEELEVF